MSELTTQEQEQAQEVLTRCGADLSTLSELDHRLLRSGVAAALGWVRERFLPFVREWDDDLDYDGIPDGGVTCPECQGGGEINKDGKPSKRYPPTHNPRCALAAAMQGTR